MQSFHRFVVLTSRSCGTVIGGQKRFQTKQAANIGKGGTVYRKDGNVAGCALVGQGSERRLGDLIPGSARDGSDPKTPQ